MWRIRERFLKLTNLCSCTNSYHGHKAGLHGKAVKDGLCQECWNYLNIYDYKVTEEEMLERERYGLQFYVNDYADDELRERLKQCEMEREDLRWDYDYLGEKISDIEYRRRRVGMEFDVILSEMFKRKIVFMI